MHYPLDDKQELIRHLCMLGEIQGWLNGISGNLIDLIPNARKTEIRKSNIYLTPTSLCEILTKHYYKIQKQKDIPRFTLPVLDLLVYLQEAALEPVSALAGTKYFQTLINTGKMIGFDRNNFPTCFFTIISDVGGRIQTAYPGFCVDDEELFN